MSRSALSLVLALLAAGCIGAVPGADLDDAAGAVAVDAEGFAPVLFGGARFLEIDLVAEGGRRLHADALLPDAPQSPDAPTRFPTVLLLSPYWGSGVGAQPLGYMPYDFLAERLVPRGYAVVFGDLAGSGGSSGCWDFMGPVERASAVEMVEAVAAQEWSDGKVAMHGLSYDGMTQIMAASDAAPHLTTVIPAAPLTTAYRGLIMNGVHYSTGWHATVGFYESSSLLPPYPNQERVPGWTERLRDSPACLADNHSGYTATNAHSPYFDARDYRALGANVKVPVFYIQGFLDGAVKPDNFGEWFDAVPTLKKAWLGHWFHQYPTAENAGRTDLYLTLHRWLDHTMKGIDNGIDREPAIDVQDGLGRWRREASWPPADAAPVALALGADGALATSGATAGTVGFGGATEASNLLAGGSAGVAAFESEPFATGLHVAGVPWVNLTLSSDRPAGQVIARLYDGDRLVTQGAYNLLYAGGLASPAPLVPGEAVTVSFGLYPTDWAVLPGNALRLELATQDPRLWFDPDAPLATLTLEAGESATLTLPTVERGADDVFLVSCGKALQRAVDGCFLDLEDDGVPSED